MAKQVLTTTEYVDDLSGGKAEGTVAFGFEGQLYEIDLSKANTRAFQKALAPYLSAARKVRASRTRTKPARAAAAKHDLAAIREWARTNGYDVSARGRVATAVIEAYSATQ